MGMAVSFAFMWVTALLEMWFFKPVFVDGVGARYLQWRDSTGSSVADRVWFYIKVFAQQVKRAAYFAKEQWLARGWPFIKDLLKK